MRKIRKQAANRNQISRRIVAQAISCVEGLESRTLLTGSATAQVTVSPPPSPNPYTQNSSPGVTLYAIVAPASVGTTPTGTVQFEVGSTLIGAPATLVSGLASLQNVTTLPVGNDNIIAIYSGDSTYAPATSPAVQETVQGSGSTTIGTTTALASNVNNAPVGTSVIFTASVSPDTTGGPTETGSVTFTVDGMNVTPASNLSSSGQATYSTSGLTAGMHTITATYSGDGNYNTSTSASFTENINGAGLTATTTAIMASPSTTVTSGASVTFTATVSPTPDGGMVQFESNGVDIGGPQMITAGQATFTTSSLAVGMNSITAVYSGDMTYATSASPAITETVNSASLTATSTTVSTATPTTNQGQSVMFTATVSPTPTPDGGTVQFQSDGVDIGSPVPVVSGSASYTTNALATPSDTITAIYSGDASYATSTSPGITETVNPALAATTTTVSTTTPTINVGQNVMFTATVSATPTPNGGSVQFLSNGVDIGAPVPLSNGTASYSTASLPAPSDTITAVYSGDSTSASSTSAPFTETVNGTGVQTFTSISTMTPTITAGSPVTFTATISPTPTPDGGTVQFKSNGINLGTPVAVVGGSASLTTSALTVPPSDSITAVYSGDSAYAGSTSAPITEIVNTAPVLLATTTTLGVSSPTSVFGASVVFTATVSPGAATGTVQFDDGGVPIAGALIPVMGGMAQYTTSMLALGAHNITAIYSGDMTYKTSTSATVTETVNPAPITTTTTLTAVPTMTTVGNVVMLTATVTPASASGTVQFFDGTAPLGSPVKLSGGTATLSTSSLIVGMHSITATYNGDAGDSTSTSMATMITVAQGTPTLTVSTSAATIALGQTPTFTAIVAPAVAGGPIPTGTVDFLDGMMDISGPVMLNNGIATFPAPGLTTGSHNISFSYSGDMNYMMGNANPITETVNVATSTVALVPTPNPVVFGNPISLTANITPGTATGTVTFFDGSNNLGMAPVIGGSAMLGGIVLPAGANSLTAVYSGDMNDAPATSAVVTETVDRAASSVVMTTDAASIVYGNPVGLTATVTPADATGTVTFYSGGVKLGTGTIMGGMATLDTSILPVGTDNIDAVYSGDGNYTSSTSPTVTQTVTQAMTTTTVTANPVGAAIGSPITLTTTVTPQTGTATPTGTVSIIEDGEITLATGLPLTNGTSVYTTTAIVLGTNTITAVYSGDSNYLTSTSAGTTVQITAVTSSTSIVSLVSTTPAIDYGNVVTFTATVSSAENSTIVPTGSVTFYDGTQALGAPVALAAGIAFFNTTSLPPGTDYVTAVYSGDSNYVGGTSSPVIETVSGVANSGVYVTSLSASAASATFGNPVTLTASVQPQIAGAQPAIGGTVTFFSGSQTLGAANLAANDIATFSTPLPAGTDEVTAAYNGGGPVTKSLPAIVAVSSAATPSFAKAHLPPAIIVGTAANLNLPLVITNLGSSRLSGPFTIDIYLDTSPTLDSHKTLLTETPRTLRLNPHKSAQVHFTETLQPNLPSGSYYLLAQVTDPNGLTNLTASKPIVIAPPFVSLAATVSAVKPTNIGIGQSASVWVTITNNGNEDATGLLNAVLSPSSDGVTSISGNVLGTLSLPATIPSGKSHKYRLTLDSTSLATGSYFPYVSASLGGVTTTAVGTTAFTVG